MKDKYKFIKFEKTGPVLNQPSSLPPRPYVMQEITAELFEYSGFISFEGLKELIQNFCEHHNIRIEDVMIGNNTHYDSEGIILKYEKEVPKDIEVYKKEIEKHLQELAIYKEEKEIFPKVCDEWYEKEYAVRHVELEALVEKMKTIRQELGLPEEVKKS